MVGLGVGLAAGLIAGIAAGRLRGRLAVGHGVVLRDDPNVKVGNTTSVGRSPYAVYDYESGVQPSTVTNSNKS